MKLILLTLLLVLFSLTAYAEDSPVQKFVASINSVEKAKSALKSAFETLDSCRFGSCFNNTAISICEIVAALDVNVNGKIIEDMSSFGKTGVAISSNDLRQMKKLFSQCKPTNYQYWNYSKVLHVGYKPAAKTDAAIRKYLGLKTK